ncbi:hypothetical protein BFJ66_g18383, partial [Fusarium oxysporum f. sp. cepae]
MRQYEDQKEKVKQRIQSAKSRIHISCDLWTSPNSLANLGIVAHYVTEDGQLEHHVLALKDIDSEHDGSHLAVAVLNVVDEWGFASKLGYFVMDNAGNNDTMMRSLSLGLLRRYDIQYDLRDAIDGYFNKWMESDCAGDELSPEDWVILEKVKSFLEKLK